jgi:hypothetical protein
LLQSKEPQLNNILSYLITVQDKDGNEYSLTMRELFDLIYGDRLKEITDQTKKEIIEAIKEVENEII